MPQPKMTDRERMDRAIIYADQLATDLRVLGYKPQAALVDDMAAGLLSASLTRAVADLVRG